MVAGPVGGPLDSALKCNGLILDADGDTMYNQWIQMISWILNFTDDDFQQ